MVIAFKISSIWNQLKKNRVVPKNIYGKHKLENRCFSKRKVDEVVLRVCG